MRHLSEVAPGVFVATADRDLTSSTVLVHGDRALLIDPSWEPEDLAGLAEWLHHRRLRVTAGFATHAHYDHLLWHPDFGDVPRLASMVTAQRARTHRETLVAGLGPGWPAVLLELVGRVTGTGADTLPWPDRVELIRHNAHTPGHTALWLPDRRVLIGGDMLSDVEPPLPEDTGVADYLDGLDVLRPYAEQSAVVVPGHGHPGDDALARWERDAAAVVGAELPADLDDRFDLDR